MKILTGLFLQDDASGVVRHLIEHGFDREQLSMMSKIAQIPDYLEEGEPEDAAVSGATVGAVTGSSIGALSSWAVSAIPGFESFMVTGFLMATAVGGVMGGYLGSLYNVRAEDQVKIDIHEELAVGKVLVVVQIKDEGEAETAVSVMEQNNGEHLERLTIPEEAFAKNQST